MGVMVPASVLLALASMVAGSKDKGAPQPVRVQLYGESGCPATTAFIFGPLAAAQAAPGVAAVMSLEWTPFGNAYFITKECGGVPAPSGCGGSGACLYNSTVRDCYFEHCGLGALQPLADCYGPGQPRCQHGQTECAANRVEACVKVHAPTTYWASSACIEKAFYTGALENGKSSEADVLEQAKSCGVDTDSLASCYSGAAGDQAVEEMAKATPPHPGVPYVLINGTPLEDESGLLKAICKAYTGPTPAGCLSSVLHV